MYILLNYVYYFRSAFRFLLCKSFEKLCLLLHVCPPNDSPKQSMWDILCLLPFLLFLLWLPNEVCETYCFCSVSYYYYSSFICINFVRHVSRRCLDQTLWNLVGISYAMWSCAFKCWFFSKWLPLPWKQPKC
jgi:hypothetical protein